VDSSITCAFNPCPVRFDAGLVRKYDGFGPRYTSYPTADRFGGDFGACDYLDTLDARNQQRPQQALSVYVHLPFCNTICYYCACNKVITKDRTKSAQYIDYVCREIGMVDALLEGPRRLVQLHWGGGTPTFLSHGEMSALMRKLRGAFNFEANAEVSIEVDPRKVDSATIDLLADLGFNRLSVGIQDFDPAVQRAVNRIQSEAETRTVIDAARRRGFVSVNADLIYGLPLQTVAGFGATLDKVVAARPDRIALYSYAHVPHMFKPQRRIDEAQLPPADDKLAILALAIEKLGAAGYVYIGMDHFALPTDELAVAQREGTLHRNFQGYSTLPDTDLIGLGVSAIGKVGNAYVQNVRTLDEYYARLDAKALPVMRGIELDDDDVVRRDVIQRLMCDFRLDPAAIGAEHGLDFARYFATELEALTPMCEDGLVEVSPAAITVTASGRLLVRAVAMTFDRHLREARERARYSRVI